MRKQAKIALTAVLLAAVAGQLLFWIHAAASKRNHAEEAEGPLIHYNQYQPTEMLW